MDVLSEGFKILVLRRLASVNLETLVFPLDPLCLLFLIRIKFYFYS